MDYKKTVLKNGLRTITVPMKGTQTVTIVVMVGVGSRYETEKEAGLSHFIEHMFFKGTKKRPNTLAISEELDSVGGEYNAFTSKDKTGYYAKVDVKHFEKALDVVSDIYLNSKIERREIDRERGTIIQELNMYEDTPLMSIGDVFETLLYDGNELGREIIGYKKTLKSLERKDFIDYINRFYVSNDTVICIAGNIDEKSAIKKVSKYFSGMRKGKKISFNKVRESQKKPEVRVKYKDTEQTHLVLGARAYPMGHKDRFVLSLISIILGGNMSSRLFMEVRERRGLAYYVKTQKESYRDCGYLATQSGVDHGNLKKTVEVILNEYKKIAAQKVSSRELQKAKDFIRGKAVMGFESSDEVAMFFIEQELMENEIMTMKEIFRRIDAVTPNDIQRVAKDIFQNKKINLAVIGPHDNEKELIKILNF